MDARLIWDEAKRQANHAKHGLDFQQAGVVLGSRYRLDIPMSRHGEQRVISISYALGFLAVLTVAHTGRGGETRIISFRRASREEREIYHEWLENEYDDS